jgi:D-alanyl-D-alanine carboxypeptidase
MKKLISLMTAMAMVLALASCGAKPAADNQAAASAPAASSVAEASTPAEASAAEASAAGNEESGESTLFTKEDMDSAIALINAEFANWEHCDSLEVSYTSDEECNEENIAWMNSLADEGAEPFTQCMKFVSTFSTDAEADGAWEPETEYNDYEWWLARTEGGQWQLMTWGY